MGKYNVATEEFSDSAIAPANPGVRDDVRINAELEILDYNQQTSKSLTDAVLKGAPLAIVSGLSTVIESMPGVDDNEAREAVLDYLPESYKQYYQQNEKAIEATGDIVTSFIPFIAGAKLIRAGSFLGKYATKVLGEESKIVSSIFSTGKSLEELAKPALEAASIAGNKFTYSLFNNKEFSREFYKAWRTAGADLLKESVAGDIALVATMNSSDFFFPEQVSWTDTAAMFAAFDVGFAGLGSLAVPYSIRRGIAINAGKFAKSTNPRDLPLDEAIQRAGERDSFAAVWGTFKQDAEGELRTAAAKQDPELAENLRAVVNQIDKQLYGADGGVVFNMASDRPFAEINKAWQLDTDTVQQVIKPAMDNDPSLFSNLRSIDPYDAQYVAKFQASDDYITATAKLFDAEINELKTAVKNASDNDRPNLQRQLDETMQYRDRLMSMQQFVLDQDGALLPLSMRKIHGEEFSSFKLTKNPAPAAGSHAFSTVTLKNEFGVESKFRLLANGVFELPTLEKIRPQERIKQVTVIAQDVQQNPKNYPSVTSVTMKNFGDTWAITRAAGERAEMADVVYESLSKGTRNLLEDWIAGDMATLRQLANRQPEIVDEIQSAYKRAGLHDALREIADADGTITVYRGESKSETKQALRQAVDETAKNANDIVSVTPVLESAMAFGARPGKHVVKLKVPVEEIVGVVGGLRGEYEFIIRGAAERKALQGISALNASTWQSLTFAEKTALLRAGREYVRDYGDKVLSKSGMPKFAIGVDDHYARYDMAVEIANKYGIDAIELPRTGAIQTLGDLEFYALNAKFKEYQRIIQQVRAAESGALKLPRHAQKSSVDILKELNLPAANTTLESPIVKFFDALAGGADGKIRSLTDFNIYDINLARQAIAEFAGNAVKQELRDDDIAKMALRGSLLSPSRAETRPVILTYENGPVPQVTAKMLADQVAQQRAQVLKRLEQEPPELVAEMLKIVRENTAAVQQAKQAQLLYDGIQAGRNRATTAPHAYRTSPVLTAVDRVSDLLFKATIQVAKRNMKQFEPLWHTIQAQRNKSSLLMFNNFVNARRHGWELLDDIEEIEPGRFAWRLDPASEFNQKRWKELFGEPLPVSVKKTIDDNGKVVEETLPIYMPNPTRVNGKVVPVVADELAVETARSIAVLSKNLGEVINHLNYAQGRRQFALNNWHLPPVNLAREEVVFLAKPTGETVSVVGGPTFSQAKEKALKEIEAARERGIELVMHTSQTMRNHFDMLNEVFGTMKDYSTTFLQSGKSKGRSAGSVVDASPQTLRDQLQTLANQYQSLTRQFNFIYFEPQINFARFRKEASNLPENVMAARRTIWDQYQAALLQRQQLNPQSGLGKLYFGIEGAYNLTIKAALSKLHNYTSLREVGLSEDVVDKRSFEALKESLGEFNPFESVIDFARRTEDLRMPPSMRKHVGQLTRITTDLTLRILDLGMAAVNVLSPFGILPAVVKSLQRHPGEAKEFWLQRIAAYASPISDSRALWNPARAMASGIGFMFSKEWQAVKKEARQRGLLTQEVAERMDVLAHPAEGYVQNLVNNYTRVLSKPTDWSELWSRGFSFGVGYNMGRRMMQLSHEDALLFAHRIANETIGDFRPAARPQIFQGAVGMPLGLFTTFIWNFWQRVFRDIEGRNMGALAMQTALQQSLYGSESLPFFDKFVDAFTTTYDGQENVVDRLREAYGDAATDVFLFGTVGNLPRLFGADEGIAIQTRADVTFPVDRIVGLANLGNLPSATLLRDIYRGIDESIESLKVNNGLNARQQAEIMANYAPLGVVRNMLDVALGYDVDRRGNVINSELNTVTEIASRFLELKTTEEHKKIRELARSQAIQKRRQELLERLAKRIKADARGGALAGDNGREVLNEYIREYLKIGGDYDMFKRFLQNNLLKGVTDRTRLELLRAFRSSYRQQEAARLLLLEAPETNETGEYQ